MKPIVVIVAGGLATRMQPITEKIPKCLIDLDGKPLIQHQIEFLRDRGYTRFIFCVAHLAEKVEGYFGDGSSFGVEISYSQERGELLGTAGAIKLVEELLDETFIVYYGDNLTTLDFDEALRFHEKKKSDFTVIVRELPEGYKSSSIITLDLKNKIDTFLEKPSSEEFKKSQNKKRYINNGIYLMGEKALDLIPKNKKYDFASQLIPKLISGKCKVYAYVSNDFFKEIGRLEKYYKFKEDLEKRKEILE
ncbi:MAG: nucleotidyltransferase family protein [Candidatus Altiarchaeota archaeon]